MISYLGIKHNVCVPLCSYETGQELMPLVAPCGNARPLSMTAHLLLAHHPKRNCHSVIQEWSLARPFQCQTCHTATRQEFAFPTLMSAPTRFRLLLQSHQCKSLRSRLTPKNLDIFCWISFMFVFNTFHGYDIISGHEPQYLCVPYFFV